MIYTEGGEVNDAGSPSRWHVTGALPQKMGTLCTARPAEGPYSGGGAPGVCTTNYARLKCLHSLARERHECRGAILSSTQSWAAASKTPTRREQATVLPPISESMPGGTCCHMLFPSLTCSTIVVSVWSSRYALFIRCHTGLGAG